ncbi:MAG: TIGR00159 family protein [candidate division Zixibacteria bacterium HGW-Zixibacteria-1]|nr:MAG: TIGR00159 family protein [candidate division Zixibacteria bacterium HGW-Zixibacteria-1]
MEFFRIDFLSFRLSDLIDILIVSFIIYRLLALMKGTRAAQMVTGLVLIFIIAFVSFWFQLQGLSWLFTNLGTVGFIVLVIVFQPELRSMLAQMGHSRLFQYFIKVEERKSLKEVTRAAIRLSELRYGGLIVIEKGVGLKNFIETGKNINAELSAEVIITLFTPYTPLHDGAIIIAGEMISAAACTLPLTQNPRYRKLYGMRHKAAIGVTEVSDAVGVVVSEETGEISITYKGYMEKGISRDDVRHRLAEYLKR